MLVSIDGGAETYRRIDDPDTTLIATVGIPFEEMGRTAVEAIDDDRRQEEARRRSTSGPYLWMDAVLVDASNVEADAREVDARRRHNAPLFASRGIGKRYGAVEALQRRRPRRHAGEVVAICGDNGAGKSTLIRIVSGAHEPSEGAIELEGEPVVFALAA